MSFIFLPHQNAKVAARILDDKRLGFARKNVKDTLFAISTLPHSRLNPMDKIWVDNQVWLATYGMVMCLEWKLRGKVDDLFEVLAEQVLYLQEHGHKQGLPWWWSHDAIFASHRGALWRKAPELYSQFVIEGSMYPAYVWPWKLKKVELEYKPEPF